MSKSNTRILAIDPGTAHMGVAVLQNQKLIYHAVEVVRNKKSPGEKLKEARKIVLRLIKDFRPDVIAIEKAFFANNRSAALVNVLVDEIKAIASRKKIKIVGYAPSTVKRFICGNGRASKEEVARAVAIRYPELKVFLTQDRAYKERFHQNMFDAVAVASLAIRADAWKQMQYS